MKVKAKPDFQKYRNASLKLPNKDFRKLQDGKVVEIKQSDYDKYEHIYEVIKGVEVKDGD